jgi:hypothetical protein
MQFPFTVTPGSAEAQQISDRFLLENAAAFSNQNLLSRNPLRATNRFVVLWAVIARNR